LSTADCGLPFADCRLPIVDWDSPTADCVSCISNGQLPIGN
jgi:hypothetical protein